MYVLFNEFTFLNFEILTQEELIDFIFILIFDFFFICKMISRV